MACVWVLLASRTTDERLCGKLGRPFCGEHQREIDAMEQTDKDWDEIFASFKALCDESEKEEPSCAACGSGPVHEGCIYCDLCGAEAET
jgi:hypothetical protein